MDKKKIVIFIVVIIVISIVIGIIVLNMPSKSKKENNVVTIDSTIDTKDISKIEVSTIRFKLKNMIGKNIKKIYIRNSNSENYSNLLTNEIKDGEEVDVEYGNYSKLYMWDFKIVFDDDTFKTLNTLISPNIFYDNATIVLKDIGDSIDAVNSNVISSN